MHVGYLVLIVAGTDALEDLAPCTTMQAGFNDVVTVDSHDIARLAGCRDYSSTFLSMVEEEIAVQASDSECG
jgi:hypothetical protein